MVNLVLHQTFTSHVRLVKHSSAMFALSLTYIVYDGKWEISNFYTSHTEIILTKTGVVVIQPTFAYSKSTIETLEKGVKYVQSLAHIESNSANKSQPLFRLDLKLIV